jgi:hypothetical protein
VEYYIEADPSDAVLETGVKFAAALVNGELLNPVVHRIHDVYPATTAQR